MAVGLAQPHIQPSWGLSVMVVSRTCSRIVRPRAGDRCCPSSHIRWLWVYFCALVCSFEQFSVLWIHSATWALES